MSELSLLFHVHTKASHDSFLKIDDIIQYCVDANIGCLAVTDHDSFDQIDRYENLCAMAGIRLIKGVEYTSDAGDIIGLFIKKFCKQKSCNKILEDVREQGGITIIPHPYHGHDLDLIDFDLVNVIEVFNPRCDHDMNSKAETLANKLEKAKLVAGDVHLKSELGLSRNYFNSDKRDWTGDDELRELILSAPRRFECKYTAKDKIYASQAIKGIKLKQPQLFLRNAAKIIVHNLSGARVS